MITNLNHELGLNKYWNINKISAINYKNTANCILLWLNLTLFILINIEVLFTFS